MHKESCHKLTEPTKHQEIKKSNTCNNENPEAKNKFKCKFCTSKFETLTEYLPHIENTHKNNQKSSSFMCSDCGKQYKTKNELTQHINSKCGTIKQFKCRVCDQELMSAGSLYNHMLRHNGVRSYMCRFCAKMFFTAGQLKVHERIHTQDKAYVCEVCNKGFCHRQSLITHSTLHTGIKPYQCENCGKSFSCVGNLLKHRKTHVDTCGLMPLTTHTVQHPSTKIKVKINTPSNSKLKMQEKDKEVQKEVEILKSELIKVEKEIKEEITIEEHPVQAKEQNTTSSENNELKISPDNFIEPEFVNCLEDRTQSDDDDDDDVKYNGEYIFGMQSEEDLKGKQTETKNEKNKKKKRKRKYKKDENYENIISEFMAEINFNKEGFGDCKYCGKRYMNARWLYKHVKEHENSLPNVIDRKPGIPLHKCSCCKMTFYTKEENLTHQQTHHADVLTCYECDKIFANRDSLRSHQKVFHKGLSRKAYIYICGKCGKQFKQKSFLKAHEERNCDKGPFHCCPICQKQFSSVYTRNTHMKVHDPEKKLLCKFCAKSFHWKGQLKIHERSHTGEKPFACLYCPKAFAYRESLITHSSIHTGIKPHLCDGCGSRFSCIGNLIKHKSSHASECGPWIYQSDINFMTEEVNYT